MNYIDNNGKFNHGKWLRDQLLKEETISEAPMDSRFQKEWEKSSKALLNHIKHELSKGPKGQTRAQLQLYAKEIAKAMEIPSKLGAIVGMQEYKINEGTKSFEPGDMWSNDFDYIGMLKYGAQATTDLGIETLQSLFDSFEDVNYHRESQDLGNALDWMEDMRGIEDEEKVEDFMERFRKKCAATLDVMGVKWSPKG